ncbi:electron transfer flavoprotein subunit beta/FixA family protein [Paraburkholderia caballeronis]|uniref:Protein FixA n=1 Tax=Paraburkholderia caballeronis TaxID=416943 RepID=A0A1H7F9D3_9BURK|nr:electron transfer flavoprotein subunit beta/FixA family protein [Paraburkholderia caballeronis]PXW24019.1 electron transfer flavoprotein beta subunit [Paraburkholderia caballeronis]PXW99783.1 electron transfer flavoprotein beta subunit [Paraburkholderia caballeronis]RAJ96737.1 electron transfer flavoprotein beta subunit [Paraburkholderia caballeronis]TDV15769.1 electron transfer flavoprotein beta subunit [Paraburkholderia caballeronis]TDV18024.1 electron transfer flavoprotein beta subunit [
MHIVVCIKQVPDSAQIRVHPVTNTIMRQGVPAIVNPYDLFSLEEALRLKDRFGGKVTALCMGPPQAEEALRKCISYGADDAILVTDRAFAGADTLATSYALAAAIRQIAKEQAVDVVFTGKQTIDGDTAQVGPGIAKRLGLQLLTYVSRIVETDPEKRTMSVERRAEGGVQVLRTALPCLVTMLENTNELRFATLPAMIHAAGFPVRRWNREQAGIEDVGRIGLKGSPTVVSKVFGPTPRSEKAELLELDVSNLRDVSMNLLQKIFTRHPTLEADLLTKEAP